MTGEECIGSGFYSNGAILFYASSLMLLEIKKWEHRFGTRTAPDRCQGAVSESVHAFEQTRKIQSRIVSFYVFAGFEEARLLADSFCEIATMVLQHIQPYAWGVNSPFAAQCKTPIHKGPASVYIIAL